MIYKFDEFPEKLSEFPSKLYDLNTILYCDMETSGVDPLIDVPITIQFYTEELGTYVFDIRNQSLLKELKPVLENNVLCFFNAKFDLKFLFRQNVRPKKIVDPFLGFWVATGRIGSLKDYLSEYLDVFVSKTYRTSFDVKCELDYKRLEYCKEDVVHLKPLNQICEKKIKKERLEACAALEYEACSVFADIELAGIPFDSEMWLKNFEAVAPKIRQAVEELDAYVVSHPALKTFSGNVQNDLFESTNRKTCINWDSSLEVSKVLNRFPEIPLKSKNGKISSSAVELEELVYLDETGTFRPYDEKWKLCALLLNYRKLQKIQSVYGKTFLKYVHPVTKRIHPDFLQFGSEAGRVSSRNPNCQNIPREQSFRSCFKAPSGRKIITADYSQIEIRIAAKITNEKLLMDAFEKGEDPYSVIGTKMFGKPVSKKENPHLRQIAKSILLGINYGMGVDKLSKKLNCSRRQAEKYVDSFYSSMPNLKKGLEYLAKKAVEEGETRTMPPISRKRIMNFKARTKEDLAFVERQGKNSPIQGTNADILKLALTLIHRELCDSETFIINNVHDEILIETTIEKSEEMKEKTIDIMKKAAKTALGDMRVDVEAVVADSWVK